MTIQAKEEMDPSQVKANREAQHKYLTWRAQKVMITFLSNRHCICIVVTDQDLCLVLAGSWTCSS